MWLLWRRPGIPKATDSSNSFGREAELRQTKGPFERLLEAMDRNAQQLLAGRYRPYKNGRIGPSIQGSQLLEIKELLHYSLGCLIKEYLDASKWVVLSCRTLLFFQGGPIFERSFSSEIILEYALGYGANDLAPFWSVFDETNLPALEVIFPPQFRFSTIHYHGKLDRESIRDMFPDRRVRVYTQADLRTSCSWTVWFRWNQQKRFPK